MATKTGYGTSTTLDLGQLCTYDRVLVCGADTDACVPAGAGGAGMNRPATAEAVAGSESRKC